MEINVVISSFYEQKLSNIWVLDRHIQCFGNIIIIKLAGAGAFNELVNFE